MTRLSSTHGWFAIALLSAALVGGPLMGGLRADIDAEQVRLALDRGIAYLKQQQQFDGTWPDHVGMPGGITSLCTLALLTAGVPTDDPKVEKALTYLRKLKPTMTYSVSLQTMVLCAAEPKRDLLTIRRNVDWLEDRQLVAGDKKGAWGYSGSLGTGDGSNSQFALLALHEAQRVGVSVKDETWRRVLSYWTRTQSLDGSWSYMEGQAPTGSMTCAGIAAMVIASERLNRGDAEVNGDSIRCCGQPQPNTAVERGLEWLGKHFSVQTNPGDPSGQWLLYYLHGVERAGRLTNQRFIGGHDWYREGADLLVHKQEELGTGFWRGSGHAENNPHVGTSLALLFLAKGRRPVLVAKLKHDPLDDWNHHRTDLANLTAYAEKRWQRDLTWQIIDLKKASADDLDQAPVLFLSGAKDPRLTDDQIQRLRAYIDRGGFLFAEACCEDQGFDAAFRSLVARMFPEPEHALHLLPPEHPLWGAEERVDPQHVPAMWGVDVGCRTSVVYCPQNLGCYWELSNPDRPQDYPLAVQAKLEALRSVGLNVLAYATNRELKYKLEAPVLAADKQIRDNFERAKLYLGRLRHDGGWNVAPGALPNLLKTLTRETGLRIDPDQKALPLADPRLFDYHLIFMHGRNAFHFSDAERALLRSYVLDRNGMLVADSICSSEAFTAAFRQEMAAIFPKQKLARLPAGDPLLSTTYGGFDLRKVNRREPRQREAGGLKSAVLAVEPDLEAIDVDGAHGVIFSPHDLSCALDRHESLECAGYTRDDAARIGINIILYSLQQ